MSKQHEATIIGRKDELKALILELSPEHASRQPIKFFLIKGPEGIGKKYLFENAQKELNNNKETRLFIQVPSLKKTEWTDLSDTLLDGIEVNNSEQSENLQSFQRNYISKVEELSDELEEGEEFQKAIKLELWMECFLNYFVYEDKGVGLQILFYLPDFELWDEEDLSLFSRIITIPLARRFNSPDTRFVISCENDSLLSSEFKSIWKNNERSVRHFELEAFNLAQVQKWLEEEELPHGISRRLLKESHGIPGKLQEISEQILDEENLSNWLIIAENIFKDCPTDDTINICNGLLLPDITEETLLLFHPTEEEAQKTYQLIKNKSKLNALESNGSLSLRKETLRAIKRWYKSQKPDAYKMANIKAEQLKAPLMLLDNKQARDILTMLSPFTFFNTDVIKGVLGVAANEIIDFVHTHHRYFERSAGNYKTNKATKNSLNNYLALTNRKAPELILKKIDECWHKTREKILNDIRETEEKIDKNEKDLNQLKQQVRKVNKSIKSEENTVAKLKEQKNQPIQKIIKKNNSGLSIILALLGTVILYFSILFTENLSIGYAMLGVLCLFAGIFLQSHTPTISVPAPVNSAKSVDTEKYDKNIHFMTLKKNQLHHQVSSLTSHVQRYKDQLKEYDNLLRQPYN